MFDIYIDRNKKYKVDDLYQWDTKVGLNIHGLNLVRAPEIHFSNSGLKEAIVKQSTMDTTGVISVQVPDTALQFAGNLDVYIYAYELDESRTLYKLTINVIGRKKPADYIAEDDEKIYSYNALENKLDNTVVELTRANEEALAEVDRKIEEFSLEIADSIVTIKGSAEAVASLLLHLEDKNNPHNVTYTQVGAPSATAFNDLNLATTAHLNNKENPHGITPAQIGASTAEAFNTLNTNATKHIADKNNPHNVTLQQLGAKPNENIVHNWYMCKPVNRLGLTEYINETGSFLRTIDGFSISQGSLYVNDDSCNFKSTKNANYKRFVHIMRNTLFAGVTYTLSILAKINDISGTVWLRPCTNAFGSMPGCGQTVIDATTNDYTIFTKTFTPTENQVNACVEILCMNTANDYIDVDMLAWKLEIGNKQTLASRNANGKWILNEVPEIAEQMAICLQYDLNTRDFIGLNSLLDNKLPITGGTMIGNNDVGIGFHNTANNNYMNFYMHSNGNAFLRTNKYGDGNNSRALFMKTPDQDKNIVNAVGFFETVSGVTNYYKLYATYSITAGTADLTAGTSALGNDCYYDVYK